MKMPAIYFLLIARAGVIILSAVIQFQVLIEEKEVRGTGCPISLSNFLRLIVKIGKGEVGISRERGHFLRIILRVFFYVIGGDGYNFNSLLLP